MLFNNLTKSLFVLVVISMTVPPFVALIIPLGAMYIWIQRYYLRTSRELKRLDSVSRSPIYAHFQESLGGISTIRAYRQQERFELENEWRVDGNLRAYFPSISANRWLAVRLEFIGAVVILAAAGFAVITVATGHELDSGMVGLAMSFALQITTSLNWIVRQTVEVETNIVSVERVLEYAQLPSEAPEIIHRNRPPVSWPSRGEVEFNNYSARYREGLDLVLKNIKLDIKSHEKIGVVGRTGAGKSSLTLALFRIIEPDTGNISLDGLNTSTIGLLDLRRRLAIIPQDAALFEGTIRDNLDPGHVHDDTELWSVLGTFCPPVTRATDLIYPPPRCSRGRVVLSGTHETNLSARRTEHARLKEHVISMEGGLEAKINEGGKQCIFPRGVFRPISFVCGFCRLLPVSVVLCPAARVISSRPLVGSIAARHGWVHCVLAGGYFTSRRLSPLFLEFAWQKAIHPIASALPRAAEGVWREVLRRPRRHFLSYLALAMCTNACFCRVGYAPVHKQALAGSRMQCTWLQHWISRTPSAAWTLIPRYYPPCYIRLPLPLPYLPHPWLPFTECDCRSQAVPAMPASLLSPEELPDLYLSFEIYS